LMKLVPAVVLLLLPSAGVPHRLPLRSGRITVVFGARDAEQGAAFRRHAAGAQARIAAFFGSGFGEPVELRLCGSRAEFDGALAKEWGMPKSEPWMVGAAGSAHAFFLSPRVWKTEAQEHDSEDVDAIRMLVAHELTHSYHAQHNPSHDLDGLEPMAWFVEGLATLVSGQLDARHRDDAARALEAGTFPLRLEDVWSGKARYGLAGSLVRFVDEHYGRRRVIEMLSATTNQQALEKLGTSEERLLAEWRRSLALFERWPRLWRWPRDPDVRQVGSWRPGRESNPRPTA
jgi:hypothetical protein